MAWPLWLLHLPLLLFFLFSSSVILAPLAPLPAHQGPSCRRAFVLAPSGVSSPPGASHRWLLPRSDVLTSERPSLTTTLNSPFSSLTCNLFTLLYFLSTNRHLQLLQLFIYVFTDCLLWLECQLPEARSLLSLFMGVFPGPSPVPGTHLALNKGIL